MVSRMMIAKKGALVPNSAQTTAAAMAESGEEERDPAEPGGGELIWGLGPLGERFGVNADFEVLAEDGDVFAKIEAGAEIVDGSVALEKSAAQAMGRGASAARVSSPMRVRARERSSKRLPGPKRSRSVA